MYKMFSVIIPVYNVEDQLKRCVDSFIHQTFNDFELILVDDGSTDRSGEICDWYSKHYTNIETIHQMNSGVSSARNAGLDAANGKYIVFADSDDFVSNDLLTQLAQSDADLVIAGFCDYYHGEITKTLLQENSKWRLDSTYGILQYLNSVGSVFVWGRRYKKSIIRKNSLHFREDFKISEDIIFNNDYILSSHTVEMLNFIGYYHCQYDSKTLSSKYIDKMRFCERNKWREIAYNQFSDYPDIQEKYTSQTLFYAENEFVEISHKKILFSQKCKLINEIIKNHFFRMTLKRSPNILPKDVQFFCFIRQASMIVLKYGRK